MKRTILLKKRREGEKREKREIKKNIKNPKLEKREIKKNIKNPKLEKNKFQHLYDNNFIYNHINYLL